eukprot:5413463-Pyramimonas_sp.AAC.1
MFASFAFRVLSWEVCWASLGALWEPLTLPLRHIGSVAPILGYFLELQRAWTESECGLEAPVLPCGAEVLGPGQGAS